MDKRTPFIESLILLSVIGVMGFTSLYSRRLDNKKVFVNSMEAITADCNIRNPFITFDTFITLYSMKIDLPLKTFVSLTPVLQHDKMLRNWWGVAFNPL